MAKADQKQKMSERIELFLFPALAFMAAGTRRAASARSPSFAYFYLASKQLQVEVKANMSEANVKRSGRSQK
jgi:hypothetical protein